MIAKLSGHVDSVGDDWAVVDVAGVGYLVFCATRTLAALVEGARVTLFIETHVREDHFHLYGFRDAGERDWFRLLTTVQGVGTKVALAILSVLGPADLVRAIAAGDRAAMSRSPGVGAKLAGRILSELREKAGAIALGPGAFADGDARRVSASAPGTEVPPETLGDAVSALVNLGYAPSQALGAVARIATTLGSEASLEALIRGGLSELGRNDGLRGEAAR